MRIHPRPAALSHPCHIKLNNPLRCIRKKGGLGGIPPLPKVFLKPKKNENTSISHECTSHYDSGRGCELKRREAIALLASCSAKRIYSHPEEPAGEGLGPYERIGKVNVFELMPLAVAIQIRLRIKDQLRIKDLIGLSSGRFARSKCWMKAKRRAGGGFLFDGFLPSEAGGMTGYSSCLPCFLKQSITG